MVLVLLSPAFFQRRQTFMCLVTLLTHHTQVPALHLQKGHLNPANPQNVSSVPRRSRFQARSHGAPSEPSLSVSARASWVLQLHWGNACPSPGGTPNPRLSGNDLESESSSSPSTHDNTSRTKLRTSLEGSSSEKHQHPREGSQVQKRSARP